MREAELYKTLTDQRVQCRLCNHFCIVAKGEAGTCGVRTNRDGKLFTLVDDKVAALGVDPVEKKPLFHFMPGTRTLSFATMGCNLSCSFCQNFSLSQPPRNGQMPMGQAASPAQLVASALEHDCGSISYTYSEPTVFFELIEPTATLAVDKGLKNIMVSNGFMSPECLDRLGPIIHAANIDLKSFSEDFYKDQCGARLAPVLENLKRIRELGWWLEVTTLVIPGLNDSDQELADIAGFIAEELGIDVPWHVSRFHPDFEKQDVGPTSVATLERAWAIGEAAGLQYVYTGNVPGHDAESTRCPGCGTVVVSRRGFTITGSDLKDGACAKCGQIIAGVDL
ncbi:AmmeMemoRadiSam system radical SAM enzyme [Desulfovibrio ferrophilus]|uniref:Radical SAM protein n=1 Tax=Desulfovibrio ferrophilus TaxID=241368 RepID=A0A2Z6AZ81_9BACT|nr:AmmeMemoRadiSam system radical SAM enzyme [Desulfovibrio ferrophilus]BBD08581.1 radical SAM protein [Desulfovibrio ferrophilus]